MEHEFTPEQKDELIRDFHFTEHELGNLETLDLEIEDIYNGIIQTLNTYPHSINHNNLTILLMRRYTFLQIINLINHGFINEDFKRLLKITLFDDNINVLYSLIEDLFNDQYTIEVAREYITEILESQNENENDDTGILTPDMGGKRRKTRRRKQSRRKKQSRRRRRRK
jgi:hypothetical protein